jgi:tetratricopeptide (TPR) repeat protein
MADVGRCDAALKLANEAAEPVAGFPFTNDGLEPLLQTARSQFLLGMVSSRCGSLAEARQHFESATRQSDAGQIYWAYAAARKLGSPDMAEWRVKLQRALQQAEDNGNTSSYSSLWLYHEALLEKASGQVEQADRTLTRALLLPDRMMAHHLSRLARAQLTPE